MVEEGRSFAKGGPGFTVFPNGGGRNCYTPFK